MNLTPSQPDTVQSQPLIPHHSYHVWCEISKYPLSPSYIASFLYPTQTFHFIYLSFLKLLLTYTLLTYTLLILHTSYTTYIYTYIYTTTHTTYLNHLYIQQSALYILYSHYTLSFDIYTDIILPFYALPLPNFHKNSRLLWFYLLRGSLRTSPGWIVKQQDHLGWVSTALTCSGAVGSWWGSFSVGSDDSCCVPSHPYKSNNGLFSARDKSPWGTLQISTFSCTKHSWVPEQRESHKCTFLFPSRATHTAFPSAPTV